MDIIAIIGAKSGGERLPNKNILKLGGKPVIAWVIDAALKSSLTDEVYVFTDSEQIAQIARFYGAKVPVMEPTELLEAGGNKQAHYVLEEYRMLGIEFDMVAGMAANCPLVTGDDIDNAIKLMLESDKSRPVTTVCKVTRPPWWMWNMDGSPVLPIPGCPRVPERAVFQDQELVRPNGAVTVSTRAHWETNEAGGQMIPLMSIMPPERSLEIDSAYDLYNARCLVGYQQAIPSFTDLHKGQRAWILATGPHLATITPAQWAIIDQDITIGVNNSPATHDSKYLLWADQCCPQVYPSVITSEADYKFTLHPTSDVPEVIEYGSSPAVNRTFEGGLTARGCSTHSATHLAIVMGCNPICIIGCDFGAENVHATYQPQLGDRKDIPYDATGELRLNWGAFAEMTKYLGRTILNACEYSGLECWPKLSVDDIIAKDRFVIPKPEPSKNGKGLLYPLLQQVETTMRQLEWANQAIPAILKRLMPSHRSASLPTLNAPNKGANND